jgi:hypothetical protein
MPSSLAPTTCPPTDSAWAHTLDRTGVVASVGCAVHCMVAPLLLILTPTLGGIWVHPVVHLAIAALVLPVAALALRRGSRRHGREWILWSGGSGMALVLLGALWPMWFAGEAHAGHSDGGASTSGTSCNGCCPSLSIDAATGAWSWNVPAASVITLLGGIALVAAHVGNLRCSARCSH